MTLDGVNFLAIIVAALLTMVIGAVWYSPLLFGNLWMRLIGKTADEIEARPTDYLFTFIGALLMAGVLAVVIQAAAAHTLIDGALTGGLVWLGFVATSTLTYSIFEGPPKPVWALYAAYTLVTFVVMGALIGLWV